MTDISKLKPGDPHYQAYVGPPDQYDFMGATQFRLLCTLGLRASHRLLDFGCGSLRAGRLFMAYLDAGNYHGIEPNRWLIDDAIRDQVGQDAVDLKKPNFDYNGDFNTSVFPGGFDFIVAQSIFSHTGPDLVRQGLQSFRDSLKETGIIAVTFIHGEQDCDAPGWFYAGQPNNRRVTYQPESILDFAREAGLHTRSIPWYHPRQQWYLLARDASRLPSQALSLHLTGAVLGDPEFADSL